MKRVEVGGVVGASTWCLEKNEKEESEAAPPLSPAIMVCLQFLGCFLIETSCRFNFCKFEIGWIIDQKGDAFPALDAGMPNFTKYISMCSCV